MASLCILFTTYRIDKFDINKFTTTFEGREIS